MKPGDTTISANLLDLLLEEHRRVQMPRLGRLWGYYRNEMTEDGAKPQAGQAAGERGYRLAQEAGLPGRFTQVRHTSARGDQRWETVIENDIAWRVAALVDFM